MKAFRSYPLAIALLVVATCAFADERSAYFQRRADADLAAFKALDVNHDGLLTPDEIRGDNDFGPRFQDIDANGDGVVTQAELARYIHDRYGIDVPGADKATAATVHPQDLATAKSSRGG
jgi:EF hand domain-containing protein